MSYEETHPPVFLHEDSLSESTEPSGTEELSDGGALAAPDESEISIPSDLPAPPAAPCVPSLPLPNPQPPPTLSELVGEAIKIYGPNRDLVRRHVAMNSDGRIWAEGAIERTYRAEMQARKWQQNAARMVAWVRSLSWPELQRQATLVGRYAAELYRRHNNRWRYEMWRAGELEAEITRRTEQHGRARC